LSEIEPSVEQQQLPADVEQLRVQIAAELRELDALYQPRIDAHIEALAEEVERVIEVHRRIANETDLELRADTRWSAIWELSGRCLAACRAVLHDLRGGFTSEAAGNLRALWEVSTLLFAVAFDQEEELLRRWLAGEWIRPWEAREAVGRRETLARPRMEEAGIEPPPGSTTEVGAEVYDFLSQTAHHRREGLRGSIQVDLREFAYGPHPDAEVRAHHLAGAGHLVETALMIVIDSLGAIIGREYVRDALPPMKERLQRVRDQFPLPE
jgi:hypothetical protein